MTHDELQRKIQDLEQYEREKIKEKESAQDTLKSLDSEFADMKQKASKFFSNAAKQAVGFSSSSFEEKQKRIQDESEQKERTLSELEDHISEIERVLAELKRVEPNLRDLEQKSEYWNDKADNLMGRKSTGFF